MPEALEPSEGDKKRRLESFDEFGGLVPERKVIRNMADKLFR